jgi:hypothetical protein
MLSNVVGIVITPYTTESLNYGFLVVMQSIWISNDWDPTTSPQLLQDMVVDFEGYINFNDAGAEYKFTSGRGICCRSDCWYYCYVWSKS